MFTKTNLISTIITAIWGFMGGYLLWGVLADSFLNNHLGTAAGVPKEVPEWGLLALGCLIQAFAFSSIFRHWDESRYTTSDGMKYGILIGVLVGLGNELINHATTNVLDLTGALVNGLIYIVFYSVMGFLAGLIYNKVK
ncbi:hypothetical protein FEE95_08370 [Maribacter algarum]|uniref:DUF1761 domain-containing protein n=1 Tax=Maribacter algarum (ex Zhang et al. 2020) TaxID=2578118 RepID=A0A5S3PWM1_9FLAO|nr:hypothetical protein [Maribacter algarum]TMM59426.1 hypothetical protein FEE95_08370 [Maribacter algarum]